MSIFKLVLSQLKKNIKMVISMMLIGAIGIAIVIGLMGSYKALDRNINSYVSEYQLQDITLDTAMDLRVLLNVDELKKVEGVSKLDTRLVYDVPLSFNSKESTSRVISINDNSFPILKVKDEIEKSNENMNIVMESSYASSLGINLGDIVTFSLQGNQISGYVYKLGSTPECLSVKRNKWIMGSSGSYGVTFVEENELAKLALDGYYNQVIVQVKDGYTNKDVADNLKKVSSVTFTNITLYEESLVAEKIDYNLLPLVSLTTIVPSVFFVISLIINILFMYQMISHYKKEIGIILTMGYSKKDIYKLFSIVSCICGIGAIILGIGIGYGIEAYSYKMFASAFNMDFAPVNIDFSSTLIACMASLGIFILSGLFDTFRIVHFMTPIEAINDSVDAKAKGVKIKGLTPKIKIEINRLIRNYKSVLISILCICTSFVVIFAGASFRNSKNVILEDVFQKRIGYDACAYLTTSISDADLEQLRNVNGVTKAERMIYVITQSESEDKSISTLIYGISEENKKLVRILDEGHNITSFPSEGITLDSTTALSLNVSVGDVIEVNDVQEKVTKISYQDMLHVQYMNEEELLKIAPNSYYTSVLINTSDDTALKEYFDSKSNLALLKFSVETRASTTKTFKNSDAGIYIIIAMGIAMGLVIIFNMNLMSLDVDKRSYAIKLSMGFSLMDISKELIIEDIFKIVLASALGIILGRVFSIVALDKMSTTTATYPYMDNIFVYLITIGLVIGFMLVSRLLTIIQIKRMNIASLIKDKE